MWWIYVLESAKQRKINGKVARGFFYVGSTTDPLRRLKQHNGELHGGAKYTSRYRPWTLRAIYGPYENRGEALKAELALKRSKSGVARIHWSTSDHPLCRGEGPNHPWIKDPNWTFQSPNE